MKIVLWKFYRPYCSPANGYVLATKKAWAIRLVHKKYGYADGTTVERVPMRNRVLEYWNYD